jgi:hypothetical protein
VSAGQDINGEAQLAVPQVEGVASNWPGCRIPETIVFVVTVSGASNTPWVPASIINWNIGQSRACDGHTGPIQTDVQSCACFLMIVDISMT